MGNSMSAGNVARECFTELTCGTHACGFQRAHHWAYAADGQAGGSSGSTSSAPPGNQDRKSKSGQEPERGQSWKDDPAPLPKRPYGTPRVIEKFSLPDNHKAVASEESDSDQSNDFPVAGVTSLASDSERPQATQRHSVDDDPFIIDEVEPMPDWLLQNRRGAVSAEASGGFNVRFADWKPPVNRELTEDQIQGLIDCLGQLPFCRGDTEQTLRSVALAMTIERFQAGDLILMEGTVGRSGYALLSGVAEVCVSASSRHPRASTCSVDLRGAQNLITLRELEPGCFFGENTMLWGIRRLRTIRAKTEVVLGKLKRTDFFNLTTQKAMRKRSFHHESLRKCRTFECLSDEQIGQLVDCLEEHTFEQGDAIIKQGDVGRDLYIVTQGQCEARIRTGDDDDQVHRTYKQGDRFGEVGFQTGTKRGATISAISSTVVVLRLGAKRAERMLGPLDALDKEQYLLDPRKTIADFFKPASDDPGTAGGVAGGRAASWFAVYRPTSRDAISKMLDRTAVGKGLNVKGKSAKKNVLSGYVPFMQIFNNNDKCKVEDAPRNARIRIFYQSAWARETALRSLTPLLDPGAGLDLPTEAQEGAEVGIVMDSRFENQGIFGLSVPERALRKVYIDDADISLRQGWETGRQSEPAFMDMNLHAVRQQNAPIETVVYQFDQSEPLNPNGLLIAYAEQSVKPVVSDFDTFTVGSRGGSVNYVPLPPEQQALAVWALDKTRSILEDGSAEGWNTQWLRLLTKATGDGFHPTLPRFGFGDATSYELVSSIVEATIETGAIRHGAECFNFMFPQELDPEYLIVWEQFPDKPWSYTDEKGLRAFLLERATEGYAFPINPVWAVRDPGWYEVFDVLRSNHPKELAAWMPPDSGIEERVEAIHVSFPEAFSVPAVSPPVRKPLPADATKNFDGMGHVFSLVQAQNPEPDRELDSGENGLSAKELASNKAEAEEHFYPDHDRQDWEARAHIILARRRWRAAKDLVVATKLMRDGARASRERRTALSIFSHVVTDPSAKHTNGDEGMLTHAATAPSAKHTNGDEGMMVAAAAAYARRFEEAKRRAATM